MAKLKLKTTLHRKDIKGLWTYAVVRDAAKTFGTTKPVFVKGFLDDLVIEATLQPQGDGSHWLHIKKDWREAIGKSIGDTVNLELEESVAPAPKEAPVLKKTKL